MDGFTAPDDAADDAGLETTTGEIDCGAVVAASKRRQAALNALTPEQAAAHQRYYDVQGQHYLWLSALKRKRGHGDCSGEMAAAGRHAAATVFGPTFNSALVRVPRTTPRARERRERHIARSTSSGDSGSDPGSDEPPSRRLTLADFRLAAATAGITPHPALKLFHALPDAVRAEALSELAELRR